MAILLQNGTDSVLLQNGVDVLLLQAPDPVAIFTDDDGPTGQPAFLGGHSKGFLSDDAGPIGPLQFLGAHTKGFLRDDTGPLSYNAQVLGYSFGAFLTDDTGPVSYDAQILAVSDFTAILEGSEPYSYVMDVVTSTYGTVRIPISSWQATLQVNRQNYVQCTIPKAADYIDEIGEASSFTIYRKIESPFAIEYEMATIVPTIKDFTRSPRKYSCVMAGYSDGFAEVESPSSAYDRTLQGIRTLRTGTTNTNVRCRADFLLRPGQRAWIDDTTSFVVDYIHYYAVQGKDSVNEYMDVGERL